MIENALRGHTMVCSPKITHSQGITGFLEALVLRESRDFLRPRDFWRVIVQKSRGVLRPRDFRSVILRKSRIFSRPRDYWRVIVRKSRGVLGPRDFRCPVVRKTRAAAAFPATVLAFMPNFAALATGSL